MKGFSGFKSPLKQDGGKCYIDKNGKKKCPSVLDQFESILENKKIKKKEKVYQGGELPEVTIKG